MGKNSITIQICLFSVPSKSAKKYINKQSVENVINSPTFKTNLKKGRILSLLTHDNRYAEMNENIPYEDQMLKSPDLAGAGRKAWITGDAFYGEIEILNTEAGNKVKDLIQNGFDIGTSMSVSATVKGNEYIIDDILSLGDFTLRPDLEAKITKVNFSEKPRKDGKQIITFSQRLNKDNCKLNFTEEIDEQEQDNQKPTIKQSIEREGKINTELETERSNNSINDYSNSESGDIVHNETETNTDVSNNEDYKSVDDFETTINNSQENLPKPNVIPTNDKLDADKVKPVKNTELPENGEAHITNLSNDVADVNGVDAVNITPQPVIKIIEKDNPQYIRFNDNSAFEKWKQDNKELKFSILTDKAIEKLANSNKVIKDFSLIVGEATSDDTNVSLEEIHEDIPVEDQLTTEELKTLPNEITSTVVDCVTTNYSLQQKIRYIQNMQEFDDKHNAVHTKRIINCSLQQYIAEMNMPPYAILFRRVYEVIQLCRSKKQEWINMNIKKLKAYFDSYILTFINQCLVNPNDSLNIGMALRLAKFNIQSKKLMNLRRIMLKMRNQIEKTGYMTKPVQTELNNAFRDVEFDIYKFIDDKLKPSGKTFGTAEKDAVQK